MRKKIIALIIAIVIATPIVKAEETGEGQTTINTIIIDNNQSEYDFLSNNTNIYMCVNNNELVFNCTYNDAFNQLYNYYNDNYSSQYPYYIINGIWFDNNIVRLRLYYYEDSNNSFSYNSYPYINYKTSDGTIEFYNNTIRNNSGGVMGIFGGLSVNNNQDTWKEYEYFDSNFDIVSERDYQINNFYNNNSNIVINIGDKFPKIKDLLDFNSWSDYENNFLEGYNEVNLDNYNYVILTLKNYNQSDAFTTNMQVKGQIGITPIYNYGQTSKDAVTGVKVQDRCNVNYENYTTYPLYILQQDLQNNAIYVVKECISNSSFKYDESIFNITYVTQENEDNPKVVINGKTYDVIPYDDLPSTATQNEEENYIPGESGSANDTGGLDSAIKDAQNKMSEIWNTITYFTDFVGQIFSSLPNEIRIILISGFTIMIVLGIIKIFLGK